MLPPKKEKIWPPSFIEPMFFGTIFNNDVDLTVFSAFSKFTISSNLIEMFFFLSWDSNVISFIGLMVIKPSLFLKMQGKVISFLFALISKFIYGE